MKSNEMRTRPLWLAQFNAAHLITSHGRWRAKGLGSPGSIDAKAQFAFSGPKVLRVFLSWTHRLHRSKRSAHSQKLVWRSRHLRLRDQQIFKSSPCLATATKTISWSKRGYLRSIEKGVGCSKSPPILFIDLLWALSWDQSAFLFTPVISAISLWFLLF